MPAAEDDAGALDARLYDLIHRGNPGDVEFYRRACSGARDVLEIGCGTGRILFRLAEDGFDVVGVDCDRDRLQCAQERRKGLPEEARGRVRLVHADIRSLDLGRTFDRVLAPYSLLYTFLDDTALAEALAGASRHLAPDGRFAFDGYVLDRDDVPAAAGAHGPPVPLATVQDGETTVRVFEQDTWRSEVRRVDVEYTFHLHRVGRGVVVRRQSIRHRWIPTETVADVLDRSGLRLVDGPARRGRPGSHWFTAIAEHTPRA